jgi:hypothetical protein
MRRWHITSHLREVHLTANTNWRAEPRQSRLGLLWLVASLVVRQLITMIRSGMEHRSLNPVEMMRLIAALTVQGPLLQVAPPMHLL